MKMSVTTFFAARFAKFLVGVILLMMFSTMNLIAQQGFGSIKGRVTEAETGNRLIGANVFIEDAQIGESTGLQGEYYITRVPEGTHTLSIEYIGYEGQSVEVTVAAGQVATQNFSLVETMFEGEEVVAWGIRAKGQAAALTQQLNAPNIKNVVASDQIGRFPDGNSSEALQRVPGVALERDQGEGRYVQIRGGSARMTTVTFNGERIPSPEDNRQIALDATPVDILEAIEVTKALTANMDADAIGGSVNLVTKKAPFEPMFSVEAAGGYSSIREKAGGTGAITYGNRFGDDKFGMVLNGSINDRNFGSDNVEPEYDLGDNLSEDALSELQTRHYTVSRTRSGINAMLDYRFHERSFLYGNFISTRSKDTETRRRFVNVDFDAGAGEGVNEMQTKHRTETLSTMNITVGGDHLLENGAQIEYFATYAESKEERPGETEIEWALEGITFNPNISDPENIRANPDMVDGDYVFDKYVLSDRDVSNKDIVTGANLGFPIRLANGTSKVKFGGKYRRKDKTQDTEAFETEWAGDDDLILSRDNVGEEFSLGSNFNPGDYPYPSTVTSEAVFKDVENGFRNAFGDNFETAKDIEADAEDYEVKENILAGYALAELNFSEKLMVLPGIRFERTYLNTTGFTFDADTEELTEVNNDDNNYSNLFPSLHVRYRFTPKTNLRAAYTSAIARPNFFDLVPYSLRDGEDFQIGNPALDPTTSNNLDLLFEHYNQLIGVLSGGVFYKDLKNPIFVSTTDNNFGGETSQPQNGESGSITGIEVAIQQQLRFLPGILGNFGFYGNYTYVDSKITLADGRETQMPAQAKNIFNAALSYEAGGFSAQFSMNYLGDYLAEVGESDREDLSFDKHLQFDIAANYFVTRQVNIFLEFVNLTNERFKAYDGLSNTRPRQLEYYESWGRFGVRFNLQ